MRGNESTVKIVTTCLASLVLATLIVVVLGRPYTRLHWGESGVDSLHAIAVICLGAAILGFAPIAVIASRWPDQIGQAALAGTVIRLIGTVMGGAAYQTLAKPHLASFLFWAVILYCVLLAIETGFGVYLVRHYFTARRKELPA